MISTDTREQIWVGADGDLCSVPEFGIDQVSGEAILAAWGDESDIATDMNCFWIQNRGQPLTLLKVILFSPALQ
jgi:hypothetical protein